MRKVIQGRIYDTLKATKRAEYRENVGTDREVLEEIYQKKTGEFFLYGWGEVNSYYHEISRGYKVAGEDIIPFDPADVQEWSVSRGVPVELMTPEPTGPKKVYSISLSQEAHDRVKLRAAETGKSVSEIIEELCLALVLKTEP